MARIRLLLWILIPLPIVYYAHLPMKYLLPCTSVITLNPAIHYQFKTGQRDWPKT